jgi:hypothetical protein
MEKYVHTTRFVFSFHFYIQKKKKKKSWIFKKWCTATWALHFVVGEAIRWKADQRCNKKCLTNCTLKVLPPLNASNNAKLYAILWNLFSVLRWVNSRYDHHQILQKRVMVSNNSP